MTTTDGLTRRELIGRGAMLGAAGVVAPSLLIGCGDGSGSGSGAIDYPANPAAKGGDGPRVAIVGAGLAGLTCAEALVRYGIQPVVFEANPDRIGGRCWTSRGWAQDQIGEHGGEFIDTRHDRIMALAGRIGLELDDLYATPIRGVPRVWLNGKQRTFEELKYPREHVVDLLSQDARRVGNYGFRNPSAAARAMDEMSVADWLDANLDGGAGSDIGQLVWSEMAGEFGLDATDLSALNLLYEYVEAPSTADERFHIRGGNDQLVAALADLLPEGTIRQDAPLEGLAARADAGYTLSVGDSSSDETFDRVVLALPFTMLRNVDLEQSGLSKAKRACIDELGMGTNAKVIFQTEQRPYAYENWNGVMTADEPIFLSWESSLAQPGTNGLITTYPGGKAGAAGLAADEPHAPASAELTAATLQTYERADLAPVADEMVGEAWCDHWTLDPFTEGAYAAYLPGQFTRFYGLPPIAEGGIHFAGEHTESTYQGYLEGAVRSGERAANEVGFALGARVG